MQVIAEKNSLKAEVYGRDQNHLQGSTIGSHIPSSLSPAADESAHTAADSTLRAATAAGLAAALLAACGGGGGTSIASGGTTGGTTGGTAGGTTGTNPITGATDLPAAGSSTIGGYTYPAASTDQEAVRFLLQAQFSASTDKITAVRTQGYQTWLMAQLNAPAAMTGVEWLDSRGYSAISARTSYFDNTYPGDFMIWQQLMKSTDAVRKRLALALSEIFVVSLSGLDFEWHPWQLSYAAGRHHAQPRHGLFFEHPRQPERKPTRPAT